VISYGHSKYLNVTQTSVNWTKYFKRMQNEVTDTQKGGMDPLPKGENEKGNAQFLLARKQVVAEVKKSSGLEANDTGPKDSVFRFIPV
jgi:hypothetical protein